MFLVLSGTYYKFCKLVLSHIYDKFHKLFADKEKNKGFFVWENMDPNYGNAEGGLLTMFSSF